MSAILFLVRLNIFLNFKIYILFYCFLIDLISIKLWGGCVCLFACLTLWLLFAKNNKQVEINLKQNKYPINSGSSMWI